VYLLLRSARETTDTDNLARIDACDAKRANVRYYPLLDLDQCWLVQCVYANKNDPCQRCVERGFTDCGEKLPTPRKLAALRQLQDSGFLIKSSLNSPSPVLSSSSENSLRQSSEERCVLPALPDRCYDWQPEIYPEHEMLSKLWRNLTIWFNWR